MMSWALRDPWFAYVTTLLAISDEVKLSFSSEMLAKTRDIGRFVQPAAIAANPNPRVRLEFYALFPIEGFDYHLRSSGLHIMDKSTVGPSRLPWRG
jgi:hypothetical protein